MKVINSKLAAIGLAAFVFASCSSSDDPNGGGSTPDINTSDALTAALVNNYNAAELASKVANYKNTTANARKYFFSRATQTRAFTTAMPAAPAEPSNALKLNNPADLTAGKTYMVQGKGKTLDMTGKKIEGATIYVHGNATLKYDGNLGNGNIYAEKDAHIIYTGNGALVPAGATMICEQGTIDATNDITVAGNLYINVKAEDGLGAVEAFDKTDKKAVITPKQNITIKNGANVYINGSLRAKELTIEEGATANTTTHVMNATTVNVNGALQVGGFLRTETLNVKGELVATEHAAIKASKVLNAEAGSHITADYINVTNTAKDATLNLKGACKININNKSVINTNNLVTDNAASGQITLDNDNAIAVIKADKFTNNGDELINALATSGSNATFLLQFTESYTGTTKENSFEDLDIAASYLDYDKATDGKGVKEKENGEDFKSYGYEWTGDPSTIIANPKLDLVAAEAQKNDGQSATCIAPGTNNKLYVSYHTNGDKQSSGDIEVISMAGNTLSVEQSVKTESYNVDYNHLLVDNGAIWLAGNQQGNKATGVKGIGSFLGKISLNANGSYNNDLTLYPIDKNVSKIDANAVAQFNGEYVVATTKGYTTFDKDMNYWNKDGNEGKYAVTANSKLYTLDVNGTLNVYSESGLENGTQYAVGEISPKGNKAVVAVDESNGDIYVCKGENGVSKVSNGVVSQFYTCPTFTASNATKLTNGQEYVKGCANGVAVDAQYVYLACGSYGLVVLDKATGKEICHRKAYTGKSANYVAVDNSGNIFVAYGQSRLQVFKIAATKK